MYWPTNRTSLPLNEDQLGGLPAFARDAAAATARDRQLAAPYAVTLSRSSVEPFLQFADDRGMREQLFKAWVARGDNANPNNNRAIIAETLALRVERAHLLGYPDFASYKLADSMAGTPARARELLEKVWAPARRRALMEREALQALVTEEGGNFKLAPWDWRYYAEKLRAKLYAFDEAALKPFLQLDNMIQAAFFTAGKLFGLSFIEHHDIPVYHPDVRVWEVTWGGESIGLFYGDYFARPEKQGGAWMSSLRDQENMHGPVLPLILNNCNFVKSDPALLSFDDARTLFHEFGHALHGLLSRVVFPRLSGTNVARDFVELPSQLYEHWLEEPQVLERFARHYQTGAALPAPLLDKLLAARNFNQGFATVEFLASAFVDMDFHAGERAETRSIPPRCRPPPWPASACRTKSSCVMPRRISGMSFPATATAPVIIPISGRKFWMPMASAPSSPTPSIRPRPSVFTRISIPPAALANSRRPIAISVAAIRTSTRFWKAAAWRQASSTRPDEQARPAPACDRSHASRHSCHRHHRWRYRRCCPFRPSG